MWNSYPVCMFINNQEKTLSSRWLKIKKLFFFWQAKDRKILTKPMQKCQAVVIRITKMLWKHVFYWFMVRNGIFCCFFCLCFGNYSVRKETQHESTNVPFFFCYYFFLFHLLQLIESPPTQRGKFITWNCQSSWLSVEVQRRLGYGFNANQFSWPQHSI